MFIELLTTATNLGRLIFFCTFAHIFLEMRNKYKAFSHMDHVQKLLNIRHEFNSLVSPLFFNLESKSIRKDNLDFKLTGYLSPQ